MHYDITVTVVLTNHALCRLLLVGGEGGGEVNTSIIVIKAASGKQQLSAVDTQ